MEKSMRTVKSSSGDGTGELSLHILSVFINVVQIRHVVAHDNYIMEKQKLAFNHTDKGMTLEDQTPME